MPIPSHYCVSQQLGRWGFEMYIYVKNIYLAMCCNPMRYIYSVIVPTLGSGVIPGLSCRLEQGRGDVLYGSHWCPGQWQRGLQVGSTGSQEASFPLCPPEQRLCHSSPLPAGSSWIYGSLPIMSNHLLHQSIRFWEGHRLRCTDSLTQSKSKGRCHDLHHH